MGVAGIFQSGGGGGGHTESYRGYSPDCHLNIAGCLLTKRLTKGGGGSHAPQDPPGYALEREVCRRKVKVSRPAGAQGKEKGKNAKEPGEYIRVID